MSMPVIKSYSCSLEKVEFNPPHNLKIQYLSETLLTSIAFPAHTNLTPPGS